MREMGKTPSHQFLPRKSFYRYIGKRAEYPDTYKMNESGLFIRESVLDIPQVENMFGTPRAFDYFMGRKTSEEWTKEQLKDNNDRPPVTLEVIEHGVNLNYSAQMLSFENGKADYRKMSDIDLCHIIDHEILPKLGKQSVYHLTVSEKHRIAEMLYRRFHSEEAQIRRCLALLF